MARRPDAARACVRRSAMRGSRIEVMRSGQSALAIVVTQTIPRALRLNAPPVWLEAEGARRSAATIGSMTAAATASSSESSISSPSPRGCNSRPSAVDSAAFQALARQLALGRPVVAQRHHELVRPETPIMRIWSVDMRSDAGVELVHQPSDRAARRPLPVRTAIAGRDLDRHHREPPLRLSRQRRRGNRHSPARRCRCGCGRRAPA